MSHRDVIPNERLRAFGDRNAVTDFLRQATHGLAGGGAREIGRLEPYRSDRNCMSGLVVISAEAGIHLSRRRGIP